MTVAERVVVAHRAYERALRAITRRPTPKLWRILVRAAENLREAFEDAVRGGERQPAQ